MRALSLMLLSALAACAADAADAECDAVALETLPTGNHNEGASCIEGGCHDGSGVAPPWTAAGTLYADADAVYPLPGGVITLVDASGEVVELVAAQNGNFWTDRELVFPLEADAEGCTELRAMPTPVPAGSCNQGGCHGERRIHLP